MPNGKKPEWVNGVLTLVDEKPKNVMERIKTFEDTCNELGKEHTLVREYLDVHHTGIMFGADIIAYLKLRIIAAALNEGWEPQFTEDEVRWYPWFTLWTEEELSEKNDEWKANRRIISTGDYSGSPAGFVCAYSASAPRTRMRPSVLAFALRAKLSPRIAANNSSAFGLTST